MAVLTARIEAVPFLTELPAPFRTILPVLDGIEMPEETRSPCADCAMAPAPGPIHPDRPTFTAPARCCTYHPRLPNFLVGQVLHRGDRGTVAMRRRIAMGEGIGPKGIVPPERVQAVYAERENQEFGSLEEVTCPYWVEGADNCTIHADRGAVCRAWHCRLVDGRLGSAAWKALLGLLGYMEKCLLEWCMTAVEVPASDAEDAVWVDYFMACAAAVNEMSADAIETLRDDELDGRLKVLVSAVASLNPPLPEVLIASVGRWFSEGDSVIMSSHSGYDLTETPEWIFSFISRLDGERAWRDAVAGTEAELGHPIPDDLIPRLFRHGLLAEPTAIDLDPEGMSIRIIPSMDE